MNSETSKDSTSFDVSGSRVVSTAHTARCCVEIRSFYFDSVSSDNSISRLTSLKVASYHAKQVSHES